MAEKLFKGFKQVVKADYDAAVSNGTAIGYLWFVRPDASVTNEGDIYFGTRHYGHFGENDLASVTTTVTNILDSVGLPIDGEFQGFTGATLTNAKTIVQGVETLATLIDTLSAQIDAKVASISASDNSIVVDNTDSTNPKIKVQISNTEGNTLEVKENGLYVNVPTEVPYTGSDAITVTDHAIALKIADTDKVLSQDENGLIANVSLVQDSTDSLHYILKGKDETVLGEINLPKDQFLKSAEFIASATEEDKAIDASVIVGDPYLKFVFQTDGSDKTTYVSVKDLVDTYTAGNGLELANNTFSIKLDASGEKFLTLSEAGLKLSGIEKAIADAVTGGISGTKLVADVTKSGDTFTVQYTKDEEPDAELKLNYASSMPDELAVPKTIGGLTAGITAAELKQKTFSQILDDILFEELNPTIVAPSASISLKGGFSNGGIFEVGAPAPKDPDNFTTGFNRGSIKVTGQADKFRAGALTDGFIYVNGNIGNTEFAETIVLGQTKYQYHAEYGVGDEALTSKGNHATKDVNGASITNPLAAGFVNSNEVSVQGTYPYFANGQNASTTNKETSFPTTASTSTVKLNLVTWTTATIGAKFASEADTGQRFIFEFPAAKNVTKVEFYNTVSNAWEVFGSANYAISDTAEKTVQGASVAYKQLTSVGALNGALQLRFTVANA